MEKKLLLEIEKVILFGIRDYFKKNNIKKTVIGISGGLDSAIACFLSVKALGKQNVIGILMPDAITSKQSLIDAKKVVKHLEIEYYEVPIGSFSAQFDAILKKNKLNNDRLALANSKARIRMAILYFFAQRHGALVMGTSDKSEIALGYTTKFGDNACDFLPIADLWKTQVKKLGKQLSVPASILNKKPSAELLPNADAQTELGAPYEILDQILQMHIVENASADELILLGFDKKIVQTTLRRIKNNEHKRKMPPIIRLSERSFHSTEWRMPMTNKFE